MESNIMRGRTARLTVLLVQFLSTFRLLVGRDPPEIFGIRIRKNSAEVTKNTEVFFTVFGTDLPPDGYFLSTTDRCEDSGRSDILDKMIISLKTDATFKNAVRLHAPDGVPFSEKYPTFQVCNKASTSLNKVMLQVTAPRSKTASASWVIVLICCVTLVISSYCSGANFAYMRMSINDVALIMDNGEEPHKTHARKIFQYRKQSNWLICTMAVMNILVNTIFTLAVSSLLEEHKYGSILQYIVPTAMIVLLAEILPQSVCNRFGLKLAAKTRHITLLLFIVCAPIAWPLSKVVDYVLGREVREIYSEEQLKTLIKVQSKKMEEAAQGDILARIADFPKKTVQEMMTPMEDAFVLSGSETLDLKLLVTILEKGYTRIPVFEEKNKSNISTVLNVKDLATMTIDRRWTVQQVIGQIDAARTQMRFVLAAQKGESLMQEMMKGEHHLCAVIRFSYSRYKVVGLITFEDVIEEVFGDIEDDSDKMWNSRRAGIHKDQETLEWFRQTEWEKRTGLNVNATLKLIQSVFAVCPLFATLGYNILRMKELLNINKVMFAEEDDIIKPNSNQKMLIFFSGSISVTSGGKTTIWRLDTNRADFRPYIWAKSLVRRLFKKRLHALSCLGEPLGQRAAPVAAEIRCLTRAGYFFISTSDILEGLREPDELGYEYRRHKTSTTGSREEIERPLTPNVQKGASESTQTTHSIRIITSLKATPKLSKDRVDENPVKASDLRENLEILQANGGASPHASDLVQDNSDVNTVTAREPSVYPGPPHKEILVGSKGSLGSRDSLTEGGKIETNAEKDTKAEKEVTANEAIAERRKRTKASTSTASKKSTENIEEGGVPVRASKSSASEYTFPKKGTKSRKSGGGKMFSIWPFKKRKH